MIDWSQYEDDISDAISDSIDMDWSSRDGARAVVRYLSTLPERTTAWLIEEWDSRADVFKARWWALGLWENGDWTMDSTAALRFAREADAQAYIDDIGWTEAKPTEHMWPAPPQAEQAGGESSAKPATVGDAIDQMDAAWGRVKIGMSRREVFDAGWAAGFDFAESSPAQGDVGSAHEPKE